PPRARPTSGRRARTTTSRSKEKHGSAGTQAEAHRRTERALPTEVLLLLQGEGRASRLQELQPAPALHLGEGQDPLAPDHGRLPPPPGAGGDGGQAGARDGAAALRHRLAPWTSSSEKTSRRWGCAATSCRSPAGSPGTTCCRGGSPSRRRPPRWRS